MTNPLLQKFATPFNTPPFRAMLLEHYKPALEEAIQKGKEEICAITHTSGGPSFENTVAALDRSGHLLNTISSIFFNLNSAETSSDMQALAQELSPMLTAYSDEVLMNEPLFDRIKTVYETTDRDTLTAEEQTLLEHTYRHFIRGGANLQSSEKEKLKQINTLLAKHSLQFGEYVLKDSNAFELWIERPEDIAGLPVSIQQIAANEADLKGQKHIWLFTLDYPSYLPFMKYCDNRALRELMFRAFNTRASKQNEFNNEQLIQEIVELRREKAQLLGYRTHAQFTLEERMAMQSERVYLLLNELLDAAKPKALEELQQIQALATALNGPSKIERWDFAYYAEKLKQQTYNFSDEDLKPYFSLEPTLSGMFETAKQLYGLSFDQRHDIEVYHETVKTYEVKNKAGRHLAVLYADFYPRPGKRDGAWMTVFRGQSKTAGQEQRPLVSIVCNFSKPTKNQPSLLTFNELTTLFHEFGHALHGILADTVYDSLSGTNVYWDFVELPSQFMENFCYEQKCLNLFAKHYQTEEPIPMELVRKIQESARFLSGYQTLRQVGLAMLDLAWHDTAEPLAGTVSSVEQSAIYQTDILPPVSNTSISCAFSHIFHGGYAAGYYSYKWAEVLEADAFELFKTNGVFDTKTADAFREHILTKGGSEHPMTLYKRFRGKEPAIDALLRKSGLN